MDNRTTALRIPSAQQKFIDTFMGLANVLNALGPYDKMTSESNKTIYKLVTSCMESTNRALAICQNMPERLERGRNYTKIFQTEGRITRKGIILDTRVNLTDVLFTDPDSEYYCIQSLYLDVIIPEPRPVHKYPQHDIPQILKLRIGKNTHLCYEPFPDSFTPRDIADRMLDHLTPTYLNHSIIPVYQTIIQMTEQVVFPKRLNFQEAGKEIVNMRFYGRNESYSGTKALVQNLQNVPNILVRLATEPRRLAYADKLYGLDPLEKLWVTATTHEDIVDHHVQMLTKEVPTSYQDYSKPYDDSLQVYTFDMLDDLKLSTLNFLVEYAKFDVADAIEYINQFSVNSIHEAIVLGCITPAASRLIVDSIKNSNLVYLGSQQLLNKCNTYAYEETSNNYMHNFIANYMSPYVHEKEHADDSTLHPSLIIMLTPAVLLLMTLLCLLRKQIYKSQPAQYCMKLFDRKKYMPVPQEDRFERASVKPVVIISHVKRK